MHLLPGSKIVLSESANAVALTFPRPWLPFIVRHTLRKAGAVAAIGVLLVAAFTTLILITRIDSEAACPMFGFLLFIIVIGCSLPDEDGNWPTLGAYFQSDWSKEQLRLERTRTRSLCVSGDTLIRTSADGEHRIWYREDIAEMHCEVSEEHEGVFLRIVLRDHQGRRSIVHTTAPSSRRVLFARAECAWIVAALRTALRLPATGNKPLLPDARTADAIFEKNASIQREGNAADADTSFSNSPRAFRSPSGNNRA
jgi:hypothetical protein